MELFIQNLPAILCMLAGTALVVLEVLLPGFGMPGISGSILLIASVVLSWINHGPTGGLITMLCSLVLCGISISVAIRSAAKGRLSRSELILKNDESAGKEAEDMSAFLNKEGVTLTVLRPAGMGEFDGVKLSIVSDGEFIAKGTRVRISKTEGARIVVSELKQ